jgi:DNA repair protein RecO (recombination protein O)
MSLIKTPAIVLSTRHMGEADKLITFLTLHQGKIAGTARSARRIKSHFGSALEPFTHCQVILFQKTRDSLYRIQQADILKSFRELREDLDRIFWASRITSLTSALMPEGEANAIVFHLLTQTMTSLQNGDPELAARIFEIQLLKYAGYQPRLEMEGCLRCRGRLNGADVFFSPSHGGILCKSCAKQERALTRPATKGTIAFFRQALQIAPRLTSRLRATRTMRDELKNLLEAYLDHLLGRSA